jgi:hypothetical protein
MPFEASVLYHDAGELRGVEFWGIGGAPSDKEWYGA